MPPPTNESSLDRIKQLEVLMKSHTETLAKYIVECERAHERLDNAGSCYMAMRDDLYQRHEDLAQALSQADLVPA